MKTVRILIADDHDIVREGLRRLLQPQPHWTICDEAATGREALEKARRHKPHVVVMDFSMPKMNGITATGLIKRHWPETIVIGLSFSDDPHLKKAVLEAGASTLIAKQEAGEQLYPAINTYWEQFSQQKGRSLNSASPS